MTGPRCCCSSAQKVLHPSPTTMSPSPASARWWHSRRWPCATAAGTKPRSPGSTAWSRSCARVRALERTLLLTSSLEITERKEIENDLAKRLHFDELTGFPNRVLIRRHVEDILDRKGDSERFALAFIDIDNFKHINDYYNHAVG